MSAYDRKRTSALFLSKSKGCYDLLSDPRGRRWGGASSSSYWLVL